MFQLRDENAPRLRMCQQICLRPLQQTSSHFHLRQKNDKNEKHPNNNKLMKDWVSEDGIFPVVTVRVNDIMCRALIDSGAGSSYASAKLIYTLKIKPREIKRQRINMLMTTQTARMEFYDAKISSIDGNYELNVNLTKVDKTELLSINNPGYKRL
jgi:hypothetical protein